MSGVTVGVPREFFFQTLDPDIRSAVETALVTFQELGAGVRDVDLPATATVCWAPSSTWSAPGRSVPRPRLESNPEGFGRSFATSSRPHRGTAYVAAQRLVYDYAPPSAGIARGDRPGGAHHHGPARRLATPVQPWTSMA
jgi:hypothetical protein